MGLNVDALAAKIARGEELTKAEEQDYNNNRAAVDGKIREFFAPEQKATGGWEDLGVSLSKPGAAKQGNGAKSGDGNPSIVINVTQQMILNIQITADIQAIINAMHTELENVINQLQGSIEEQTQQLIQAFATILADQIASLGSLITENNDKLIAFLKGSFRDLIRNLNLDFETVRQLLEEVIRQLQDVNINITNFEDVMTALITTELEKLQSNLHIDLTELINLVKTSNASQEQQNEWLGMIYDAIKALGVQSQEDMNTIIQLLIEGNEQNAAGIDDLKDLIQTLILAVRQNTAGDTQNTQLILDAISNLVIEGGEIDLSSIEGMLAQLIGLVTAGNNTLSDIDAKMNLLNMTVNAIRARLEELEVPNYESILNQILDALGNNTPYDDSQVLAMLQAILDAIMACCNCDNGNGSGSNEGVINNDPTNELQFCVGPQPNGGGVNQPGSNTFSRDGEGVAAAIQYILSHPNEIQGHSSTGTTTGDDNGGQVGIEEVQEQQKSLEPGATAKISKAARPDLQTVFDKLGVRDEQMHLVRYVGNAKVQVFDVMGRPNGDVTLTEQELEIIFK